ncbi:hypothetical protein ACFTZB_10800 [Rhodococcus sp. NPDC057014]|uniref:hypothetical protein n=1 Tax=Rhodococcus sp. NPDC057014 TaxID=3346000 RepID=UPI003641686D
MTRDVEKRWYDPTTFRRAGWYAGAVIGAALAIMVITLVATGTDRQDCADMQPVACTDSGHYILVFVPTGILLLGGLGAFVIAYRTWRSGGSWPIWHGAGWILLTFMLIYLGMSVRVLAP